jgi:hypothetical protein
MENNNLSIDLSMFATSIKTLRENMTYVEFDGLIQNIVRANDQGKLEELLNEAQSNYSQGTDLASAFSNALFDILVEQGENY